MTLKDTITKWHGATCLLEENRLKEAMQRLMQIQNPSAKIVYNLGCISMKMELYTDAIEYFTSSLEQDKYLAISYFQRGVCFYKIRSFSSAERDFDLAKSMIPAEGIDYRQLGAKVILQTKMVDGFSRSCRHHAEMTMPSPIQTSFLDFIFYPPKKMVANLKKEDFLGKAKVISSVQESDILYAESKGMKEDTTRKNVASGVKSSLSMSMSHLASARTLSGKTIIPPSRPPPRLGRCRSVGDLLESGIDTDETDSSYSGASSLAVPKASGHHHHHQHHHQHQPFQKRQSAGECDYSHVDQDIGDSFSSYARLSVSTPVLDKKPTGSKPTVPKRPVARPRENVNTNVVASKSNDNHNNNNKNDSNNNNNNNNNINVKPPLSSQTCLEFQKIHEALRGKLNNNSGNKNDKFNSGTNTGRTSPHQLPIANKLKPFKVNYGSKSQEELNNLVPPQRMLTQSHPNLSNLANSKDKSRVNLCDSQNTWQVEQPRVTTTSTTTTSKPNRPPVPAPRKSPDRTLDSNKPAPPPRPPLPRKV